MSNNLTAPATSGPSHCPDGRSERSVRGVTVRFIWHPNASRPSGRPRKEYTESFPNERKRKRYTALIRSRTERDRSGLKLGGAPNSTAGVATPVRLLQQPKNLFSGHHNVWTGTEANPNAWDNRDAANTLTIQDRRDRRLLFMYAQHGRDLMG